MRWGSKRGEWVVEGRGGEGRVGGGGREGGKGRRGSLSGDW